MSAPVTPPKKKHGSAKAKKAANPARVFAPSTRTSKFHDPIRESEVTIVERLLQDQPGELTSQQMRALATLTRRTPEMVKSIIESAREKLYARVEEYTDMHFAATQGALADGDFKTTAHASQWAMENIGVDGVRVIDKLKEAPTKAPQVMIGIRLGGTGQAELAPPTIEAEVVTDE